MPAIVVLDTNVWVSAFLLVSRDEDLTRDQPLAAHLSTRGITVVTVARFLQYLAEPPSEMT